MAITIRSSFIVDAPPDIAWRSLIDIERSAPCFPGAELKEKQPDGSYKGSFTVKLGPLTFNFAGKFGIAEQNDDARTAIVSASGTDIKGRGGADANVKVAVGDAGNNKSKVDVVSDVNLSGSVAQYGRGVAMIEALSKQLLEQFSKNLSARISADSAAALEQAAIVESAEAAAGAASPPPVAASSERPVERPSVAPLDAGALMRQTLWHSIRRFFANLVGTGERR